MHVYVRVFKIFVAQPKAFGVGADIAYRRAGALLHNVAQLARKEYIPLTLHCGNFDCKRSSAHRRPGKPRSRAHQIALGHFVAALVPRRPEIFGNDFLRNVFVKFFAVRLFYGYFTAHGVELPFKRPYARLARVAVANSVYGFIGKHRFALFKPVGFALFGYEIALGYFPLLLLRIARKLDNFHSVEQRFGYGG